MPENKTSVMSRISRVFESMFFRGAKVSPVQGGAGKHFVNIDNNQLMSFFNSMRELSRDREARYADYKVMLGDAITRAAVKLFVEDATQTDAVMGTTAWIRCNSDRAWEERANSFLHNVVQIDKIIRSIAFYLASYGDCFLNTFSSDPVFLKENAIGDFFEVEPPMGVSEITRFGRTCGYYVGKSQSGNSRTVEDRILDASNFIHFSLNQGFMSQKIKIVHADDVTGMPVEDSFMAVLGESLLESARADFRLRQLFDFLLVLSRYNKSSYYRLFGVEVGEADAREANNILKEFTDNIETKRSMDLFLGVLNQQSAPMQTGGNIYYTTRSGKGNVSVETIGGDTDVRGIADINYFDDRYFGALSVPKQFLGQAEETAGGIGDTTLTRLDIKYGRTVKTLQAAIRNGLTDLMYWRAENVEKAVPPPFEVCMAPIATVDDDEKSKASTERLEKMSSIIEMIDNLGLDEEAGFDKKAVARYLVHEFADDRGLEDVMFKPVPAKNPESDDDSGFDDMDDDEFSPSRAF